MKKNLLSLLLLLLSIVIHAQPPVVTNVNPLSAKPGTTVTITGSSFNTIAANNIVFFGATRATVTTATDTSLSVTVPVSATYGSVSVLDVSTGLMGIGTQQFNPVYAPQVNDIPTGSFATKQDFTTGTRPYSVAMGDLNGDGKPDLAVANYNNTGNGTVSVFLNTGNSGSINFAVKQDFATDWAPQSLVICDIDGDGKLDLTEVNNGASTVSVLLNTGSIDSINFAAKVSFSTGFTPVSVALGDMNGDGKPDIVAVNYNSNTVSVLRNTSSSGSVSFAAKQDYTTGTNPYSVAIGDMDGDGKPDLAVANQGSNTVSILRNIASSSSINFAAKQDYATGTTPYSVAIGDIDRDGRSDLAVTNSISKSVSVFRNTGSSGSISLGTKQDYTTGSYPVSVAIGDIDGDGKPDLAVANASSGNVSVFRNMCSGGSINFAAKQDYATGTGPFSVALGDVDGDSKPDLAVANFDSNSVSVLHNLLPQYMPTNTILYVNQAASPGGNGSSWANAATSLADALKWAKNNYQTAWATTPLQIWVAGGIYKPTYRADNLSGANPIDRENAFVLVNNVKIYGGFAGTETALADRDLSITANKSILSGDFNGDDVVSGSGSTLSITGNGENAYHVVVSAGAVGTSILDGFAITAGNADGGSSSAVNDENITQIDGGGMANNNSSPTVSNCSFSANSAGISGGGMNNINNSSPIVSNCSFLGNLASASGGGMSNGNSSSTVSNCSFFGNSAGVNGGGMSSGNSSPIISNCSFSGNSAVSIGGGMFNGSSSPTISNCILYGNTGGTIFNSSSSSTVSYSDVEGGYTGTGNIDIDPKFTNAATGDLSLQAGSPCINTGDNNSYTTSTMGSVDLAGNLRLKGGTIDMGAYESPFNPTPIADANGIVYVKQNGTGNFKGDSWTNAAPELADALFAAQGNNNIHEIWVAGGTYKPLYKAGNGTTTRDQAFVLVNNVKIYGGFAGTETALAERNLSLTANTTTLSGDFNGDDLASGSGSTLSITNNTENAYHVLISAAAVGAASLDGFNIKGGNANGGGGITINGQDIYQNTGGGMYNNNNSSPTVSNCSFSGNKGYVGGGMYNGNNSSPIVNNCSFIGNNVGNQGGGMSNDINSSPTVSNCSFSGNNAHFGGGMSNYINSSPTVSNCSFSGNNVVGFGGGMFNGTNSNPSIHNSIIYGNTDPTALGIYNLNSTPSISYNLVQGMSADATNHNIDGSTDPMFVNASIGDLRLQAGSPCINAGDNNSYNTITMGSVDLAGNTRIIRTTIDIGAYESPYSPTPLPDVGGIVYVKQNGVGNFKGDSWANAAPELADALFAAQGNSNIHEIWVAGGVYKPLYKAGDGTTTRDQAFVLVNNVKLYGGFAGTETALAERNLSLTANKSILSGDFNEDDIVSGSSSTLSITGNGENACHVVISVGEVGTAELNGFTIKGGNAGGGGSITVNGQFLPWNYGGGVFNFSSPSFNNCTLSENNAIVGGGMFNWSSSPNLSNCTLSENNARLGGGMSNQTSSPNLSNCSFSGNRANNGGGGMFNMVSSSPQIRNSIIYGNTSGGIYDDGANSSISYSLVQGITGTSNNNIDGSTDPKFVNASIGDLRLQSGSPCINAGDNNSYNTTTMGNVDLAGNTRIMGIAIDMGAYELQSQSQTITANAQNKTYGDAPFEPGATASSGLTVAYSSADNSIAEAYQDAADANKWKINIKKAGTVQITVSQSGGSGYDAAANINFTLTIAKASLTVTADIQSKIYGNIDPALTYSYTGLTNGDDATVITGALTRGAGENVNTYAIDQGTLSAGSNYVISYVEADFAITAKPITVTADASQSKVYGTVDPVLTYSVSPSLLSGDSFTGTLTRAIGNTVGTYGITQGNLSAGSNYTISYVGDNFTIIPKSITVTADASQSKVYGTADPVLTYSVSPSLVSGDSFTGALTRVSGENVGTYAINQGTLSTGSNYTISYVGNDFAITAKPITVTATTSQSKVYGTVDPTLVYTVSPALVSGDSFSGTLARNSGENVGAYTINRGTLSAGSNYAITYVSSNFTITAKPITVTATAGQTKVYGTADPVFVYTVSPSLVSGDSFTGVLARTAGSNVGTYAINQGSLSAGSNYAITYVSSNFTITAKPITVTATAGQTKVYGTTDPVFVYTVSSGLVSGDSFIGALTRTAGSNVGTYAINQGTLSAGSNYAISYVGNTFEITKANQLITWNQALEMGCEGVYTVVLTATSNSGLAVSYTTSNTSVAAVSGNSLVFKDYGFTNVIASQPGNNNYNAASNVVTTVVISQPDLIRKQSENSIFFDNSSKSFLNYYSWYKNGQLVPNQTGQYYKEKEALNGIYFAKATRLDGMVVTTCPITLSASIQEEYISIVPNPVKTNGSFQVVTNVESASLQNARIEVYSLQGILLVEKIVTGSAIKLKAPSAEGIYIVKMTLTNGKYFTKNLLVKN